MSKEFEPRKKLTPEEFENLLKERGALYALEVATHYGVEESNTQTK